MKKFVISIIIVLTVYTTASLYFLFRKDSSPENKKVESYSLENQTFESNEFSISIDNYEASWIEVKNGDSLHLFSNLEEKLTSKEAKVKRGCNNLVSGGFYNQEGNHIGLFISDSEKISKAKNSSLFNGYFYIDKNDRGRISSSIPNFPKLALQSGPILIKNSKAQTLNLKNDEQARRIVVTVNKNGQVIFIVIYNQKNLVSGPLLSELPEILVDLEKNTSLNFENVLNLDGGAHSAFISDVVTFTELSTIGSYFCIN